jgi:hypothetical protein
LFRPHNAPSLNISFIYIILQHIICWSIMQYPLKSATLACSSPWHIDTSGLYNMGYTRVVCKSYMSIKWVEKFLKCQLDKMCWKILKMSVMFFVLHLIPFSEMGMSGTCILFKTESQNCELWSLCNNHHL